MRPFTTVATLLSTVVAVFAKNVVVTVGNIQDDNATSVFSPAEIFASLGDQVIFNFTTGNHTVTQSDFATPCIPIHETNSSVNGFDSGFRDTVNGTAITQLAVKITADDVNNTVWFYDVNTCAQGGVGGININDSSTATLDGFARNAMRLNGTNTTTSSSTSSSSSPTSTAPAPTGSSSSSGATAQQHITLGVLSVVPLILAALAL